MDLIYRDPPHICERSSTSALEVFSAPLENGGGQRDPGAAGLTEIATAAGREGGSLFWRD
jgi:hypothetical protein